ncbi:DUF3108 domain-containing protein [Polynucleobacter sphagniphilus]|jgi:hypothetical protein|uniref:DUF3108 domain-containing protein n=1 Tax=Polynucleobacter sphagniphilus TaxID=1743169 RepID=A0AA43S5Z6_9BURK|nr:DUF3108 domain-containing protein [Polynucleobacter sphagniphilus]MDF9787563.1 hypothetical protein [Polynucleobacter sphagniphilus]MDH6240336.1 hypothetical protein [Polynucleobacter sphagniphilus]MDH6300810.1 hypothetical protein [Polynucleobacter sphagniphilus]MDH6303052.1 hypothetical protein [Polynucleobacter sphagniphilus]MDH6504835.1 hypothetical protein [Polynucleobacter sphagniphilus]
MKTIFNYPSLVKSFIVALLAMAGLTAHAQTAQFEYDLKITADPAKRAAYLKQSGEAPSPYEQVFSLVKGSMQVATVVDKVDLRKDQYHINSTGTLAAVLATVLNDQKLIRDSVGANGPNGLVTNTYQEKRGNTELLIAKVDAPKSIINFYKVSSRSAPIGTAPYAGKLLDMLTVGYQFIGRDLPAKSVVLPVTDGRSLKTYTLVRGEPWDFPFDGAKVKAIRYYKTTSKDDTATFEIWFSEKEHVPLRSMIGLNAQYGATIQVDLKKIPKL